MQSQKYRKKRVNATEKWEVNDTLAKYCERARMDTSWDEYFACMGTVVKPRKQEGEEAAVERKTRTSWLRNSQRPNSPSPPWRGEASRDLKMCMAMRNFSAPKFTKSALER